MTVALALRPANDNQQIAWMDGEASCSACRHVWHAVAPVGTVVLECPRCERHRGAFIWPAGADDGTAMYVCPTCMSTNFAFCQPLRGPGRIQIMCIGCSEYQPIDDVFPR